MATDVGLSVLLICCLCGCSVAQSPPFDELFFNQTIDHFNFYEQSYPVSTFRQRYLIQDKWWKKSQGPIFVYTGNEGDVVTFWKNTGFMFDIAPKFGALIVFIEHRFYGKSLPFDEKKSFLHPYVDLLTTEQAMADFAVLITSLKSYLNAENSAVIAFGGSYGGMLSAYMRFRYPNIIDGSIAASAPILVVSGDSPRDSFYQDVTKHFHEAMSGCSERVADAFKGMAALASSGKAGYANISATFSLCDEIKSDNDYHHLIGWIRSAFATLAMVDYPYPTDFLAPLPGHPVKEACNRLVSASSSMIGLSFLADLIYGNSSCHDIYSEYVECSDPTGCGIGPNSLAWDYQACTEFIMPSGTNNRTDMFPELPFTLEQRDDYCLKHWQIRPRNKWAKLSFWGKDIGSATNIVFSNGLLDPWAGGGVLKNVSESVVAVLINDGAHHLDLRGSNPADPQSVKDARQLEISHIKQWIKNKKTL